jgi:hypothetical protein
MSINYRDPAHVGPLAAGLLAVSTALPWLTVSGPFFGEITVSGYKQGNGDGIVFLAAAALMALLTWRTRSRRTVQVFGGLFAAGYVAEYVYALVTFEDLPTTLQVAPGIGLILGVVVGVGLLVWRMENPAPVQMPTYTPPPPAPAPSWVSFIRRVDPKDGRDKFGFRVEE